MRICKEFQTKAGFTLVELTVSLGILVLLLAAVVPLWQLGLRIWLHESGVLAVQQEGRIVLEMVAREIRHASKDSVEIVVDSGTRQPALKFVVDEGAGIQAKISYLQDGAENLIRRKDKGDGAGTNVYLTNLTSPQGFSFAFVNPHTGSRRTETGCRLAGDEVIELVLCCRSEMYEYKMQTQVVPRN